MNVIAKYYGLHEAKLYIEKTPEFCSREFLYRTLLANCVRQNKLKKAEKVFGKIQDFELPITVFTCNELLYLYMRNDCKEKIGMVLGLMEKENIKPSSLTYSILIDTLGQSKDINGDFMKAQGIEPAIHTQAVLAMHYILGGLQAKGETLLKEMGGAEYLKQNWWLYPILLHVYGNLGRVDEVGKIWEICDTNLRYKECLVTIAAWGKLEKIEDEMVCQVKKWKNFLESWEVMLKVYKDNNMLMDHKKLLRRMGASECFIDPVTLDKIVCTTLLSSFRD